MAPPSDRSIRMLKRSFTQIKGEIESLLKQKFTADLMVQIEILNEGSLKPTWEKFESAAMEFFLLIDEKEEEDLAAEKKVMQDQSELRLTYSAIQAKVKSAATQFKGEEMRRSILPKGNSTMIESSKLGASDQPKLKKIEIPEFDGDLSKFYNFKALFLNLVHNNSDFSNVQKLFYLKQALVGKAAIVLQDCDLAEDAYPEAWTYFLDRYESKRAIIKNYFVKLSMLQPIRSEHGIREILDQTMAIIRGLKVAGETVNDTFSRYIAFQITNKLDSVTAKDWENHNCEASTYPKFEELFKFLQGRTFVIDDRRFEKPKENKEERSKFPSQKKSFLVSSNPKAKCPMCKSQHFLNQCETFKAMNPHRRFDFVKEAKLCLICFSREHTSSSCTSNFKCRCGQPHHNLLHFDFKNSSSKSSESNAQSKTSDNANEKDATDKKVYTTVVNQEKKVVLLPSAVVGFKCGDAHGNIRILGDNCAQPTMVSDRLVKRHRLQSEEAAVGSMIGGVTPGVVSANRVVRLLLISRCTQYV